MLGGLPLLLSLLLAAVGGVVRVQDRAGIQGPARRGEEG